MPTIDIKAPITGQDAAKFQSCFPKGVIGVKGSGSKQEAFVANPRLDTVSKECLRHPEFQGKVALDRDRSHYICTHLFKQLLLLIC